MMTFPNVPSIAERKKKAIEAAAARGEEWDEEEEDDEEVETELLASLVATIAAEGLDQPLQVLITVRQITVAPLWYDVPRRALAS